MKLFHSIRELTGVSTHRLARNGEELNGGDRVFTFNSVALIGQEKKDFDQGKSNKKAKAVTVVWITYLDGISGIWGLRDDEGYTTGLGNGQDIIKPVSEKDTSDIERGLTRAECMQAWGFSPC